MKFANCGTARTRKNRSRESGLCGLFSRGLVFRHFTRRSPTAHRAIATAKTTESPNASWRNIPVIGPVAKARLTLTPK